MDIVIGTSSVRSTNPMNGFNQAIDRSGSSCLTVREWLEWGHEERFPAADANGRYRLESGRAAASEQAM
jgi:hypothetical protein